MPHPRTHREIAPRRSVGLVILIIPPALHHPRLPQPARMPSPRAHLSESTQRRVALPIVIHPPANGLTTHTHRAGMRSPRAHLRENPLRSISAPKAATPPTGNLSRSTQSAGMQIPRANRAEFSLRRLRLPIVKHIPPKATGSPALDRAVALTHRAGKMPACGNIAERAVRRVRIPTPASDPTILPPNRAVVPLSGADRRVTSLRNLKQLRSPFPPTVNAPGDVQRASVVAPGVKRDVAAHRSRRSSPGKSQNTKQQRSDRQPDQEGFMPPPPPIAQVPPTRGKRVGQ